MAENQNMEKFKVLGLSDNVLDALAKKGWDIPSEIQEKTIPLLLKGERDIVGQAATGTGKTGGADRRNSRHRPSRNHQQSLRLGAQGSDAGGSGNSRGGRSTHCGRGHGEHEPRSASGNEGARRLEIWFADVARQYAA